MRTIHNQFTCLVSVFISFNMHRSICTRFEYLRGDKPCESVPNDRLEPKHCTVEELALNMKQRNLISGDQQKLADRIIKKSEHLIDTVRVKTEQCKIESDYRIRERLQNIEFLLDEVAKQKTNSCCEEDALKSFCNRLMNALTYVIDIGKKNAGQMNIFKEKPNDVHLTNDEIDRELSKEKGIIDHSQDLLEKALSQASEQLRLLRSTIYALDRELCNKSTSLHIDQSNLILNNNQKQLEYRKEFSLQPYTTSQEEWERQTHLMVENTTKELAKSKQLRSYFDILMKEIIEDISKQVYRLNEIIRKRIAEYRRAKQVLEEIHKQSGLKVNKVMQNIAELEKEMLANEGYVRVCQMRLGSRAQRPIPELCDDKVEATLIREYKTLRETVININQMITESNAARHSLLQAQMLQEDELNRKTNMLKLYEVDCMTIRESIDFNLF